MADVAATQNRQMDFVRSISPTRHYFACRVLRFVTLGALGVRSEAYEAEYVRRQVEFLSCIINPGDERFVYDLRIIAEPDPDLFTRGRIHAAIVGRLEGMTHDEAVQAARDFLSLIQSMFNEYDLALAPASELPSLLQPFPVHHLMSVTRRCGWQSLDSLRSPVRAARVGFDANQRPAEPMPDESKVFHIFPFLSTFAPYTEFFRLLQLHPSPVALSCRISPTRLRGDEEDFLESQIAQCEKYAQLSLGMIPDHLEYLKPTLQRQSVLHEHYLLRLFHGLKDDAAVMTIQLASPRPIPFTLADAMGHLISEPAPVAAIDPRGSGGAFMMPGADDIGRYLSGGYEVVPRDDDTDAIRAFSTLDLAQPRLEPSVAGASRLVHLFDAGQAAAAFRLPQATDEALVGVATRRARYQAAPPSLPEKGVLLGVSGRHGARHEVRVAPDDRLRHVYIVGQTGTGKTTMLKSMILDDVVAGAGVCVIDPHGDLFRELLGRIPQERVNDVVVIDPVDAEHPVGLNLLELQDDAQRYFVVQELAGIIARLTRDRYGTASDEWMGPMFFQHVRNNLLLVMSKPEEPGTLVDFCRIFSVPDHWKRWMPLQSTDPELKDWVEHVLPESDYLTHARGEMSVGAYIRTKFEDFIFDPMVRNIFGQKRSTIDLRAIMDGGKILLVNLAKGLLTEQTSRFFGMVILAKLQAAGMSRVRMRSEDRRPFHIYVDEFQSIASENFVSLLSEGRKFGIGLVLANQFISQVENRHIMDSVFGNTGTLVAFRVGQRDADAMEQQMRPLFSGSDLTSLPNWHAAMTTLVDGQAVQPFTVETVLPTAQFNHERADEVRLVSRARYTRPSTAVERELRVEEEAKGESKKSK